MPTRRQRRRCGPCRRWPTLPRLPHAAWGVGLPLPSLFYHLWVLQVLAHYRTDPQQGLSEAAVAEARRLHGRNELAPEPGACCGLLLQCLQQRSQAREGAWGSKRCRPRPPELRRQLAAGPLPPHPLSDSPSPSPLPAGTPFWKLVLKQFDDLLVKVGGWRGGQALREGCVHPAAARRRQSAGDSCARHRRNTCTPSRSAPPNHQHPAPLHSTRHPLYRSCWRRRRWTC